MNIPSTSCPGKLPAASTTMLQGERGPSPEQVGSVKAEIKPVGAECGEAMPLTTDISKRKTTAVKTLPAKSRKSRAASQQGSKPEKLYGTYPISRFTKDDLEQVTKEIMRVEANQAGPGSKQKLAALKVQEFILGKLTGQYDDATLLKIEEYINLLCDELYPKRKNKQDIEAGQNVQVTGPQIITSPVDLWPVIFDQEYPALAVNLVECKKKMLEKLQGGKEKMKKALKCKEKSEEVVAKAAERTIRIIQDKYINEIDFYLRNGDRYFSMVLPCVEYIYHERWVIETIDQLRPGWCDGIIRYGIEILPDDEQRPTPFEKRILACHQLYREYMEDDTQPPGCFKRIDLLERYQGQIKFDLENKEITRIEAQQLIFLWCYNLFRLASSRYLIHICMSGNQEFAAQGSGYREKCLSLARSAIKNGFLDVTGLAGAQQQSNDNVAGQSENPGKYDEMELQDLIVKFGMHVARNDQLQQACINAIYASEMIGSEESFNYVMAALSRCSPLPLLVRIWHDLGIPEIHYHWTSSKLPGLECAIDFLIKSRCQRKDLLAIEPAMENEARQIKTCDEKQLPYQTKWAPRIALYYFLIDKEEEGRDILRYGGVESNTLPALLLHIVNKQFKAAIELMENALKKDEQDVADRAGFIALQHPGMHITLLQGLLHKRLAEDPGCKDDEKRQYLAQASDYLSERVSTCTELYLPMAEIQNKRGDYHGACESYRNLEQLLARFPNTSYENCQLYFIRQAKEILEEFGQDISEDAFSEHEDFLQDAKEAGKSKEAAREKPVSMIPTTRSLAELSSGAEGAVLPSVPVGMESLSEVAVQDQALAVCSERLTIKGEDMQWESDRNLEPVIEKMHVSGTGTIDALTEEVVQKQRRVSSAERYRLYNELLFSGDIDYKKLLAECDNLYENTDSIFLRLIIRQDKMWILRHKTFDAYALECESRQTGVPVMKIKIDSRKEILDGLCSNIEGVLTRLMSEDLPKARGWKNFPTLIFRSERFIRCQQDQAIAGHFWTQFGAQFSAIGNVAEDVFLDQPKTREMLQHLRTTLGAGPTEFKRRSGYFRSIAGHIQNKQQPPQQQKSS